MKLIIKLFMVILMCLFIYCYFYKTSNNVDDESIKLVNKIDSLNIIIDSLSLKRTNIDKKIDTIYINLDNNDLEYEKNYNNIINNNVSEDYMFFSEYINNYKSRYNRYYNF